MEKIRIISQGVTVKFDDGVICERLGIEPNTFKVGDRYLGDQWHGSGTVTEVFRFDDSYTPEYEPEWVQ